MSQFLPSRLLEMQLCCAANAFVDIDFVLWFHEAEGRITRCHNRRAFLGKA